MKFSRKKITRHIVVGLFSLVLVYAFYQAHLKYSSHALFRSTGDAGFVLLFLALAIGPLGKLWSPANKLLPWRRQFGIWFAVLSLTHTYVIFKGWLQWDIMRFFGYQYIPDLGRIILLEPGFGLANILGIVALFWTLILAATSADWALRFLGGSAWKWIQNSAILIFYLTSIHALYFFFMYYTVSFHRGPFPPSWFRYYAVGLMVAFILLQVTAFIKTVKKNKLHN